MPTYRVQEIGGEGEIVKETVQQADSAEGAARIVLGLDLVRGTGHGIGRRPLLKAKVYRDWTNGSPSTMVRLYQFAK